MDQSVSYDQLNKMVTRFSSNLAETGIGKGDNVALVVGNSPHFLVGLYGTMKAGATVIPVNPIYTADEMHYILQNGDVKQLSYSTSFYLLYNLLQQDFLHLKTSSYAKPHQILTIQKPKK